jgi:hypothetical protein
LREANECACEYCSARRLTADRAVVVQPYTPDQFDLGRANALHEALRSLVDVVDRIGGYLSSEDQAALWRARRLVR